MLLLINTKPKRNLVCFFSLIEKYLETSQIRFALAGNGPIICNKYNGEVVFCGTNKPPDELIMENEQKFRQQSCG